MLDLDLIKTQYESLGYLHLPKMMDLALVERVRKAFDRATEAYRPRWEAGIREGTADSRYCDIENILDCDDVFVELADLPNLRPVLLALVGEDVQLNHTHARLFPPGDTYTAPWHSDLANVLGIDLAHSTKFFLKVHYFFEDLRPDQGCLAFIPGSHRLPVDYPRPRIANPESSPLVVKVVPKAGDLVLFNTHVLHMALDNTSPITRKSLIYAYSHFWVKHYANAVPGDLDKHAATPFRRQLFGVEEPGVSYFDQRANGPVKSSMMNSFGSASKKILRRVMRSTSVSWKK